MNAFRHAQHGSHIIEPDVVKLGIAELHGEKQPQLPQRHVCWGERVWRIDHILVDILFVLVRSVDIVIIYQNMEKPQIDELKS